MKFCDNWALWAKVGGHAGPPLPLLRPSSALRASSGLRSGNGGPACQPTFGHSALFSQNLILSAKKSNLSAKTKLSANGNPFILIIYLMTHNVYENFNKIQGRVTLNVSSKLVFSNVYNTYQF